MNFVDETPLITFAVEPQNACAVARDFGGFGIGAEQADTEVGRLSGGQARLSTARTIDAPHLLILDEPTNHLDIESREALLR